MTHDQMMEYVLNTVADLERLQVHVHPAEAHNFLTVYKFDGGRIVTIEICDVINRTTDDFYINYVHPSTKKAGILHWKFSEVEARKIPASISKVLNSLDESVISTFNETEFRNVTTAMFASWFAKNAATTMPVESVDFDSLTDDVFKAAERFMAIRNQYLEDR